MQAVKLPFAVAAAVLAASAADLTGTWKAVFPNGDEPKTVGEVILELRQDAGKVTGTAHVGNWPGEGAVVDGRVEGDRVSFTVYGSTRWWNKSSSGEEASGLPKLLFVGTIQGDRILFTMTWGSVMLYGKRPPGRDFELRATRVE